MQDILMGISPVQFHIATRFLPRPDSLPFGYDNIPQFCRDSVPQGCRDGISDCCCDNLFHYCCSTYLPYPCHNILPADFNPPCIPSSYSCNSFSSNFTPQLAILRRSSVCGIPLFMSDFPDSFFLAFTYFTLPYVAQHIYSIMELFLDSHQL